MKSLLTAALLIAISAGPLAAQKPIDPCCSITGINRLTGIVTAKVTATGAVFEFRLPQLRMAGSLKTGQGVFANFAAKQVSLDGTHACCTITRQPQVAASPAPRPSAPARPGIAPANPAAAPAVTRTPAQPAPGKPAPAPVLRTPISYPLPTVEYGDRQPARLAHLAMTGRFQARTLTATVAGQSLSGTSFKVRGLDGIEGVPGLPDGARRLLEMHVRRIPRGESDYYIVNPTLAAEWIQNHPVPDSIKPVDTSPSSHSGCNKWTWHCAGEAAKHAAGEVQKMIDQAQDVWDHAAKELAHDWNVTQDCFADQRLPLPRLPVQFQIAPTLTVPVRLSTPRGAGGRGGARASVGGTVALGMPITADFTTNVELFYVPCLPFAIRPRSVGAEGTLTVGERFSTDISASGAFSLTLSIPPAGNARIPVAYVPVIIGHVPVAELDISAYVGGLLEVGADGRIGGHFEVQDPHTARFSYECGGNGCSGAPEDVPVPTTVTEAAGIDGHAWIKPSILTAIQLDFDNSMLGARAGMQPYVLGNINGCGEAGATQSSNGTSSSSGSYLLAGDLDWGMRLRAETLIGGNPVGLAWTHSAAGKGGGHLWFGDLAPGGSTALRADVTVSPAAAGQPAQVRAHMPSCYPYSDGIRYRLTWTGNALPLPSSTCQWSSGEGYCTSDPAKELTVALRWPSAGTFALTVTPVGDSHHRTFNAPPREVQVSVTP